MPLPENLPTWFISLLGNPEGKAEKGKIERKQGFFLREDFGKTNPFRSLFVQTDVSLMHKKTGLLLLT